MKQRKKVTTFDQAVWKVNTIQIHVTTDNRRHSESDRTYRAIMKTMTFYTNGT